MAAFDLFALRKLKPPPAHAIDAAEERAANWNARDCCDLSGAQRLKEKIEAYWAERDCKVDVKLVEAGFVAPMRSKRVDLRSDMINALPKNYAPSPEEKR